MIPAVCCVLALFSFIRLLISSVSTRSTSKYLSSISIEATSKIFSYSICFVCGTRIAFDKFMFALVFFGTIRPSYLSKHPIALLFDAKTFLLRLVLSQLRLYIQYNLEAVQAHLVSPAGNRLKNLNKVSLQSFQKPFCFCKSFSTRLKSVFGTCI